MDPGALLERIRQYAMPEGAPVCRGVWLRQEGEMRLASGGRWLPFQAEQSLPGGGIDFRWQARVRMAPLLRARVVDSFEGGKGTLVARILGLPVARASGPATDRGEAMRGLAELPWRPFGFRQVPGLVWTATGPDSLRAAFDDTNTRVAVDYLIDGDGRVLGASAPDRPRAAGKSLVETPWSGSFGEYRRFDRVRVPAEAEVAWRLPEGPFTYWRGRITEFRILQ